VLRVRGRGVQADGKAATKGDLLVTVDVQVPINVNGEQRDAIEALAKVLDEDPRATRFARTEDRRKNNGD